MCNDGSALDFLATSFGLSPDKWNIRRVEELDQNPSENNLRTCLESQGILDETEVQKTIFAFNSLFVLDQGNQLAKQFVSELPVEVQTVHETSEDINVTNIDVPSEVSDVIKEYLGTRHAYLVALAQTQDDELLSALLTADLYMVKYKLDGVMEGDYSPEVKHLTDQHRLELNELLNRSQNELRHELMANGKWWMFNVGTSGKKVGDLVLKLLAINLPVLPADRKVPDDPFNVPTRPLLTWEDAGFVNTTSGWQGEFTITPGVVMAVMRLFAFSSAIGQDVKDLSLDSAFDLATRLSGIDWPSGGRALNYGETRAFIGRAVKNGLYNIGKSVYDGAKSLVTNDYNSPVFFPEEKPYALFSTDYSLELFNVILTMTLVLDLAGAGKGLNVLTNMLRSNFRIAPELMSVSPWRIAQRTTSNVQGGIRVIDINCSGDGMVNLLLQDGRGATRYVSANGASAERLDLAAFFNPATPAVRPMPFPKTPTLTQEPVSRLVDGNAVPARPAIPKPDVKPTAEPRGLEWSRPADSRFPRTPRESAPANPMRHPLPEPKVPTARPVSVTKNPSVHARPSVMPKTDPVIEWVDPQTRAWIDKTADYLSKQAKEIARKVLEKIQDPALRAAVASTLARVVDEQSKMQEELKKKKPGVVKDDELTKPDKSPPQKAKPVKTPQILSSADKPNDNDKKGPQSGHGKQATGNPGPKWYEKIFGMGRSGTEQAAASGSGNTRAGAAANAGPRTRLVDVETTPRASEAIGDYLSRLRFSSPEGYARIRDFFFLLGALGSQDDASGIRKLMVNTINTWGAPSQRNVASNPRTRMEDLQWAMRDSVEPFLQAAAWLRTSGARTDFTRADVVSLDQLMKLGSDLATGTAIGKDDNLESNLLFRKIDYRLDADTAAKLKKHIKYVIEKMVTRGMLAGNVWAPSALSSMKADLPPLPGLELSVSELALFERMKGRRSEPKAEPKQERKQEPKAEPAKPPRSDAPMDEVTENGRIFNPDSGETIQVGTSPSGRKFRLSSDIRAAVDLKIQRKNGKWFLLTTGGNGSYKVFSPTTDWFYSIDSVAPGCYMANRGEGTQIGQITWGNLELTNRDIIFTADPNVKIKVKIDPRGWLSFEELVSEDEEPETTVRMKTPPKPESGPRAQSGSRPSSSDSYTIPAYSTAFVGSSDKATCRFQHSHLGAKQLEFTKRGRTWHVVDHNGGEHAMFVNGFRAETVSNGWKNETDITGPVILSVGALNLQVAPLSDGSLQVKRIGETHRKEMFDDPLFKKNGGYQETPDDKLAAWRESYGGMLKTMYGDNAEPVLRAWARLIHNVPEFENSFNPKVAEQVVNVAKQFNELLRDTEVNVMAKIRGTNEQYRKLILTDLKTVVDAVKPLHVPTDAEKRAVETKYQGVIIKKGLVRGALKEFVEAVAVIKVNAPDLFGELDFDQLADKISSGNLVGEKRRVRDIIAKWHPDKHGAKHEVAYFTEVFRCLLVINELI